MITLLVDEAYAFDYLAILDVKFSYSKSTEIEAKITECSSHIKKQIGESKFCEITSSREWNDLVEANRKTFEWVDKAKTDSCKASDVDRSNYDRCKARSALQEKFFPGKKITEVKFGYREAYDTPPPKIAILTCTTKNRKWLYDITNTTKEKYVSDKNNFTYIFSDSFEDNIDWGVYWLKPQFIKKHLSEYDYVLWMDDDAGFIRFDDLTNILNLRNPSFNNKSIFVSGDENGLNAGVILLKNDKIVNDLLDFEIECAQKPEYKNHMWGDNVPFVEYCNMHKDNVCLVNCSFFNGRIPNISKSPGCIINNKTMILHIAGGDPAKRLIPKDTIKHLFNVK